VLVNLRPRGSKITLKRTFLKQKNHKENMSCNSGDTVFSYFRETLTNATNIQRPIEYLRNAISLQNHI
jgi:hypothetical protein